MPSVAPSPDLLSRLRAEIRRIERRPARRRGALPCGLPEVDALLPGGFPCGALCELRGGPASGKTAAALALVARLPRDALAAWVDGRGELYPPAAAGGGVDLSRLLIVRPPGGEEGVRLGLWAAEALLGSGAFAAVVMDVPLIRAVRGADVALRRLVQAAELGGAAGLWLAAPEAALRPPAVLRLMLWTEVEPHGLRRRAARVDGTVAGGPGREAPGGESPAPRRAGGVHAA
jgi:hypothetical protein